MCLAEIDDLFMLELLLHLVHVVDLVVLVVTRRMIVNELLQLVQPGALFFLSLAYDRKLDLILVFLGVRAQVVHLLLAHQDIVVLRAHIDDSEALQAVRLPLFDIVM